MKDKNPNLKVFPKDFLWGASTSAHQVEGGNYNQWSVWELAHANELSKKAPRRRVSPHMPTRARDLYDWEEIKEEVTNPSNYVSGDGVQHYKRYKEDFDLLEKLNLNSYRFCIEWSRIQPEEGSWNEEEIEYYRNYIRELKKRNIEPIFNLWHWTNPVWFEEKGGFKNRANVKYFTEFARKVAEEYADELRYVITVNEPNNYATISYLVGKWPPQEKSLISCLRVYVNLLAAHKAAYKVLKQHKKSLKIGVAHQLSNMQAKRPHNLIDVTVTKFMRYFWNWWFLNRINKYQDFVGFNYYFSDYYRGIKVENPKVPTNDLGWYMEPEGLYPLLLRAWSRYKKPIIVTENGIADRSDKSRRWWIEETIVAMERALSEGVEIHGYFHWSLLDNFEWSWGWWPKFGLVEVDRKNGMKRKIRPSALWFAEQIKKIGS
jgi:beta-glucosidase